MNYRYVFNLILLIIPISLNAQSKLINEEKFISIGGIEQWITVKTNDSSKPVILFLHGGPGSTMSQYKDAMYGDWKNDFILVNWDQRGAGRTFGRNAPANAIEDYWIENPLTVEQMTSDGIQLSEFLIKYLSKTKIIIIGTSWGSVLGLKMALTRPDLFYAYIGHSQVVNAPHSLLYSYSKLYDMVQSAKDYNSEQILNSIGSPPYDDAKDTGELFSIIKKYERENSIQAPESWWKLSPQYDNEADSINRYDGDDYSFVNFAGHKTLGIKSMSSTINFMKDSLHFEIPVYLIQGENDILTPFEITKEYYDKIKAPVKNFFLIPGAAHGYNQSVVDMQFIIVTEYLSL